MLLTKFTQSHFKLNQELLNLMIKMRELDKIQLSNKKIEQVSRNGLVLC